MLHCRKSCWLRRAALAGAKLAPRGQLMHATHGRLINVRQHAGMQISTMQQEYTSHHAATALQAGCVRTPMVQELPGTPSPRA